MIFQQPEHSICTKKYSYHSWSNTGVNLRSLIPPYGKTAKNFSPWKIWKLPHNTNMFFQPMSDIYTLIMGLLAHSWFEIMEFSQILVIPAFWHWKIAAKRKWSNFSKKRQYFLFICVESNLTFCRKEIWSFLKVLDYQILEELINLRFKCSFLSLVQVTSRVQVTPFH